MAKNPLTWLLNSSEESKPAVDDPAFSLTKVLAVAATVVLPVTTSIVQYLEDASLTADQVVRLILGVLLFLAVVSAADLLARGVASAAKVRAEASKEVAAAARASEPPPGYRGMLTFDPPMRGLLSAQADRRLEVHALAEVEGAPRFLCSVEGEKRATWLARQDIAFSEIALGHVTSNGQADTSNGQGRVTSTSSREKASKWLR